MSSNTFQRQIVVNNACDSCARDSKFVGNLTNRKLRPRSVVNKLLDVMHIYQQCRSCDSARMSSVGFVKVF